MDQDLELRHLRYFVAVAEELHFGRAALRLHLAQPPLSQQIRKLEEIVGHRLFDRTSRSVSLTSAGEALLLRAQRLLRNVQQDVAETRAVGRGEVGSLNIGFVGSAMLTKLPSVFNAYREAYPGVTLHLHESFTSRVVDGLERGTLDAGVLRDADPGTGLEMTEILSEPFVAVLPSTHARAGQKSIDPGSLRGEPFVYYPRSAGTRAFEKPMSICEAHGFRPRIVQEASHWITICRLVGAGLGVSIAPACVRHFASKDVACIPLRSVMVRSELQLATLTNESRPIVQGFARIVLNRNDRGVS
jgi:DNA-binding transcriptional LysR family regulator